MKAVIYKMRHQDWPNHRACNDTNPLTTAEELREAIVNLALSENCSPGRKYINFRRKEAFE